MVLMIYSISSARETCYGFLQNKHGNFSTNSSVKDSPKYNKNAEKHLIEKNLTQKLLQIEIFFFFIV